MAKKNLFTNPAFKKDNTAPAQFNLVSNTSNFNSVFNVQPLAEKDASLIENLITEGINPEIQSSVEDDIRIIKNLTAEIRSIGKQGLLLMGERVSKARDLLKQYRYGTFTKWLIAAFGNKKSGYNILSYFDFYSALPDSKLKEKFRQLPQKAAYMLASRHGDMKQKEEIVESYNEHKAIDLINLIHEKLPIEINDKRTTQDKYINRTHALTADLKQLLKTKRIISEEGSEALTTLSDLIDRLLKVNLKKSKIRK